MTATELKQVLKKSKHIHFIGIGGSGMYPLAQILHSRGYFLTGSDNNETETLDAVRKMGIPVFFGQRAENIDGADLIVHTAAIMADNPELIAAHESDAVVIERSELLGLVTSEFERAVCISGTHGKTTTSAMLTQILIYSKIDISCVIGGKLNSIGGSGRAGKSDIMVCESCEFVDTFLKLYPDIAVILNVDEDHLDYFKTLDNLKASFKKFASNATKCIIYNGDDKNTCDVVLEIDKEKISFGWKDSNDYSAKILSVNGLLTVFEAFYRGESLGIFKLHVPGSHNVLNALAAIASALYVGAPIDGIKLGLDNFKGAIRRFEKIAEVKGITIVDDYAHHPAEVSVTLSAAKSLGFKRLIAVHQPFTYSRTAMLLDDFAKALSIADLAVLTEIMGSREKNTYNIHASDLQEKIEGCALTPTFDECVSYLLQEVKEGDLVITLGCGDIYKVAKALAKKLEERK
ncbi:MAG: UDP-N-acetylmuramate--L-alanine ligase [Oscillospiraceae bacterium]|nr:UDP-N-acetylmuramate--L-alanine ligase [Oscillospiraceae bacterium]